MICATCGYRLKDCGQCGALKCACKVDAGQVQHYNRRGEPYPRNYGPLPIQKELEFDGLDKPFKDPRYICAQGHDVRGGEHRKQCIQAVLL